MKINELVIEAVKQRLDPKCWKGKHKEGTKIKGGVRVNNCVPNESIEESKVTPSAKDLKLADALEDYANKNISEREPGFGDFMYHAELIRKGHKDVHRQDLTTVQKKYRKTMNDMIKQHLNETRQAAWTWLKKKLPKWPDYVLRDWVYNLLKGDFPRDLDRGSDLSAYIDEMLRSEGLSADTVWKLVPDFQFSLDTLNPWTVDKIKRRWGGASDAGIGVPNDAARHATQKAIIQKQGGIRKEPVIIVKKPDGYELVEGWHRTIQHFAMYPDGYKGPAWIAVAAAVAENTADNTRISEGLTYLDPVSKWIAVFKASKHPKFDGKTAEQREKMARMAQYKAVQNKKPLSEAASKENIYDILEPENCGPFDGGCILVAQALKEIHGGDIVVLVNDRGNADHAVVKIGNRLIDYDGSLPVEQFIKRFEKNEHVKVKGIRPLESGDLPDASRNQSLLPKIVDLLSRKRSKTLSESKKRKAKTLIDGMIKSLIKQGRTHDEAVSDLKRQVDARFYEHIDAIAAMITEQNATHAR